MGATVVDTTYAKWGCGLGMELSSSGGTAPTKTVYSGSAKCFDVTLTGNSGGNPVRIGFSQSPAPASDAVSPYKEIPAFTARLDGPGLLRGRDVPQLVHPADVGDGQVHQDWHRRHARRHAAADPGR